MVPHQVCADLLAELNFERDPALAGCFADNDPAATVRRIQAYTGQRLPADATVLLFLDEVQAAPDVDFVAQHGSSVLPVEVKAGAIGGLKSLHSLMARRKFRLALRFNADLPSLTPVDVRTTTGEPVSYKLLSLPLYLVEEIPRLLDELEALEDGRVPGRGRRGGRRGP